MLNNDILGPIAAFFVALVPGALKKAMYDAPQQQLWLFLKAMRVATLRNLNDCMLEKMILSWRHAFC